MRRFPDAVVFALVSVLPPVFQSLVALGVRGAPNEILDPVVLRGYLEDSPYMPALLA